MRPRLAAFLLLCPLLLGATGASAPPRLQGSVVEVSFPSHALLRTLHAVVYLPPGYAGGSLRYPVVYFLHGLPASSTAYLSRVGFVSRALERTGRRAIVVVPQGAGKSNSDPEYHDWGLGRNWATALGVELPRFVDSRFRTIPDRGGRAIVGISAGGYGAMIIGVHRLHTFSVIESWSGYFAPTDPSGNEILDLGSFQANAAASVYDYVPALKVELRHLPALIAFYVGSRDGRFLEDDLELNAELAAAGVPHVFAVYPGDHDERLWSAHAAAWLSLALDHLVAPSAHPGRKALPSGSVDRSTK